MSGLVIRQPADEQEWVSYERLARRCFNDASIHLAAVRNHAVTRLALLDEQVVAGAMSLRTHAAFGGCPVPAAAISLVCVAPEARGQGVAGSLIAALVDRARAEGAWLSVLWTPATGVYRRWGWEIGGLGHRWRVPLTGFSHLPRPRHLTRGITAEGIQLQQQQAGLWNGALRRQSWWWEWKYPQDSDHAFLYESRQDDGKVIGLIGYGQQNVEPWGYQLVVSDLWARDMAAYRELLGFLAVHASQAEHAVFDQAAPPTPPFLRERPHHDVRDAHWYPWMLRILNVRSAMTSRGWPGGLAGDLELDVEGLRIVLTLDGGKAEVTPGGSGRLRMDERTLAAWYAGSLSLPVLRQTFPAVSQHDIELMAALTAGAGPWLPDVF